MTTRGPSYRQRMTTGGPSYWTGAQSRDSTVRKLKEPSYWSWSTNSEQDQLPGCLDSVNELLALTPEILPLVPELWQDWACRHSPVTPDVGTEKEYRDRGPGRGTWGLSEKAGITASSCCMEVPSHVTDTCDTIWSIRKCLHMNSLKAHFLLFRSKRKAAWLEGTWWDLLLAAAGPSLDSPVRNPPESPVSELAALQGQAAVPT